MTVLGLDIGGANIKSATPDDRHHAFPFPLWKQPEKLGNAIQELVTRWPDCDRIALTMTGELADCFSTKREGVAGILAAVESTGLPVVVWSTSGEFITPAAARTNPLDVAAANWHALTTWIARDMPTARGILIDIGSTTTDLIPFAGGRPCSLGRTDLGRLQAGELVYTGVRRTPLCAICDSVQLRGAATGVAAELFATSLDLFLWRGDLPEDPDDFETANGKPATRTAALDRLTRTVCADRYELTEGEISELVDQFAAAQMTQIQSAFERVVSRFQPGNIEVVTSGSGEFLAQQILRSCTLSHVRGSWSLRDRFGPGLAESACAYAVAKLGESGWILTAG